MLLDGTSLPWLGEGPSGTRDNYVRRAAIARTHARYEALGDVEVTTETASEHQIRVLMGMIEDESPLAVDCMRALDMVEDLPDSEVDVALDHVVAAINARIRTRVRRSHDHENQRSGEDPGQDQAGEG